MAFNIDKLALVGDHSIPGVPKIWVYYAGADTLADVNTANYFLAASRLLSIYDTIFVTSGIGGTPAQSIVYVNAVTVDSAIDVTDGLAITATDSD
jgi:hypothetical protein